MNLKTTVFLAVLCFGTGHAVAGGDLAAGEKKAKEVCAACHGDAGAKPTTPDYPVLAGQHEDYLKHSLMAYKSGKRKNAIMAGMATPLSKKEIADLAAYFAAQKSALGVKYYH
ncbi:MAG: cytochrome c [Burkholderiales bacterium]